MQGLGDLVINLGLIALIPAVGEELLFRGIIQRLFYKWSGDVHIGVWIAAILFSALHGQFFGFLPRMMLGAVLGYLLVWSGSLWLPIFVHMVNNGGAVIVAYLINRGSVPQDVETIGAKGQATSVFVSIVLTGVLLFLIYRREKRRRPHALR